MCMYYTCHTFWIPWLPLLTLYLSKPQTPPPHGLSAPHAISCNINRSLISGSQHICQWHGWWWLRWCNEQTVQLRTLPLIPSPTVPYPARGDRGVCMCIHVCLVWSVFPTAFIVPYHLPVCRQLHTDSQAKLDSIWTWRKIAHIRSDSTTPMGDWTLVAQCSTDQVFLSSQWQGWAFWNINMTAMTVMFHSRYHYFLVYMYFWFHKQYIYFPFPLEDAGGLSREYVLCIPSVP